MNEYELTRDIERPSTHERDSHAKRESLATRDYVCRTSYVTRSLNSSVSLVFTCVFMYLFAVLAAKPEEDPSGSKRYLY